MNFPSRRVVLDDLAKRYLQVAFSRWAKLALGGKALTIKYSVLPSVFLGQPASAAAVTPRA